MLKLKEIFKKPILGIVTFLMCSFLVLIGLCLVSFAGVRRIKNSI